jgi:hypothetical protein
VKWIILMKDGTKIKSFDHEDEFCIRQQIFMEYGEWAELVGESDWLSLTRRKA